MLSGQIRRMTIKFGVLAGIFMMLICAGAAVAEEVPWNAHPGEQIFSRALAGVEKVDGRLKLNLYRKNLDELAPNFTMSYCGDELRPTETNLRQMIGKPMYAWGVGKRDHMIFNRLEFQCR